MDLTDLIIVGGLGFVAYQAGIFGDIASALSPGAAPVDTGTDTTGSGAAPTAAGYLSASQIAQYAAGAGFTGNDLVIAVAIALTESSGNPNAHGDPTLAQGSFGLWQIYSGAHPEFAPFTQLFDPATNAAAAYQVYQQAGDSFTPWTGSYTNGLYLANMPAAQAAVG